MAAARPDRLRSGAPERASFVGPTDQPAGGPALHFRRFKYDCPHRQPAGTGPAAGYRLPFRATNGAVSGGVVSVSATPKREAAPVAMPLGGWPGGLRSYQFILSRDHGDDADHILPWT